MDVSKREIRDAARLAIQSAVAAAAIFIVMRRLGLPEQFVGILTAVLVVQPSVGNTLGAASDRLSATAVGCVVGAVSLALLPAGYGTAAALAISMLVMNAIAGFRPDWRYGVVAAVALSLGSEAEVLQTAIDRSVAIGAGAIVGALVSLIVWPDSASKRARRHLLVALRAISERIDLAVDGANTDETPDQSRARAVYHQEIESARQAANGIRFGDSQGLKDCIAAAERMYNSVLIVSRVAEETDDVGRRDESLDEHVRSIRQGTCDAIQKMVDGDNAGVDLSGLEQDLEAAIEGVQSSDRDPESQLRFSAIVFGLKEVVESLARLNKAMSESA